VATAVYTIGGLSYVNGGCTNSARAGGSSNTSVQLRPQCRGDAIAFLAQCHPVSGTITGITLTSPGWTLTQSVPPANTGLNSWGAIFTAIAPNNSSSTFTATFTGGNDFLNFAIWLGVEAAGNNQTGGATTFNAVSSNSGSASTCNQTAANLTAPPQ
jgi:hypothetical protein